MVEVLKELAFPLMFIVPMSVIFLPGILKAWFRHRERMAELRNPKSTSSGESSLNNQDATELRRRCDALEQRCTKLEEQLVVAHNLLADEQRHLDRKLAAIIPEEAGEPRSRDAARSKSVM